MLVKAHAHDSLVHDDDCVCFMQDFRQQSVAAAIAMSESVVGMNERMLHPSPLHLLLGGGGHQWTLDRHVKYLMLSSILG